MQCIFHEKWLISRHSELLLNIRLWCLSLIQIFLRAYFNSEYIGWVAYTFTTIISPHNDTWLKFVVFSIEKTSQMSEVRTREIMLSYSKVMKAPCWILTKKNYYKNNEITKTVDIELKILTMKTKSLELQKILLFFLPPGGVLKQKVLLLLPEWFKSFIKQFSLLVVSHW